MLMFSSHLPRPRCNRREKLQQTIPIVFAQHADPVGLGDVASLSRPGGNITGLSMLLTELSVKELEILKEIVPQATRFGVLWNLTTPSHPTAVNAVEAASAKLGIQPVPAPAGTVADFEGAFSTMVRERADGVLILGSPLLDHLVSANQQAVGDRQANIGCGVTIDDQFETCGLLNW